MRIFGGKDYYDVGMAMGQDPNVKLFRLQDNTINYNKINLPIPERRFYYKRNYDQIDTICVVFCEKIYFGIDIPSSFPTPNSDFFDDWTKVWSYKRLAEIAKERNIDIKDFNVGDRGWYIKNPINTEQFFEPIQIGSELRDYMIANKISILMNKNYCRSRSKDEEWIQNPYGLNKIGFMKALDPYTAYQELQMWIGGVLGGVSPETVEIKDDKILIENHGFDKTFSFRGPRLK